MAQTSHAGSLAAVLPASTTIDFDAIYREHVQRIIALLKRGFRYRSADGPRFAQLNNIFDVEDVCQETFTAFVDHVHRGNFDESRPAGPYLNRIAINLALVRLGKSSREQPMVEIIESDPRDGPEADVLSDEARSLVSDFLAELDPTAREVVERCLVQGQSQEEAGQGLGMSRDQVYRALTKVRKAATKYFRRRGWFDES